MNAATNPDVSAPSTSTRSRGQDNQREPYSYFDVEGHFRQELEIMAFSEPPRTRPPPANASAVFVRPTRKNVPTARKSRVMIMAPHRRESEPEGRPALLKPYQLARAIPPGLRAV